MNPKAYYNEHDPKAAAWLRELIRAGLIADGDVDERSICDVHPSELVGYTQQHFFAGIGGWSYALRLAGWPDARPVRTGSCPCQPFSAAGKQLAEKDERHLWPVFRDLITFGEPTVTFGEQVASALGREWLAGVRADLEGLGYAVGAADLCAAGVGAPHIRQRLYWVAHPNGGQCDGLANSQGRQRNRAQTGREQGDCQLERDRAIGGLADTDGGNARAERQQRGGQQRQQPEDGRAVRLEHATSDRREQWRAESDGRASGAAGVAGFWSAFDLIPCADGKARRVEPSSFPLAHGVSGRVGLLRGYGNAIVPQVAAEFIGAYCESCLA